VADAVDLASMRAYEIRRTASGHAEDSADSMSTILTEAGREEAALTEE
jgi:hypothetical protein